MTASLSLIEPDWPAPATVRAVSTTRIGGISEGVFRGFNLGDHVEDRPSAVEANRLQLEQALALPRAPAWLTQVHGVAVVEAVRAAPGATADAAYTSTPGAACVVMTADCLPVLFCDRQGSRVAAAHAGWRGLLDGVLETTVGALACAPADLMAWLGPAIGPRAFEVGAEVREAFVARDAAAAEAFRPHPKHAGKWLADLYLLARQRLAKAGVTAVYGGDYCTFSDPERFFSYRRDGQTGRQASLIWLVD